MRGRSTERRSYDGETTKGGYADVVPISPVLDAYLRAANRREPV